ncbi:Hect-domain containing peotein [Achlya hypogyna]|uniref:Hect-domain containing peotein n=1 Tax=Achlya hypogyna TaxID=1202772 RepID=A0A1V9ZIW0_ACHHY|nr:Hect-domain containing peotein [Achlya hypogyna]
MDDVDLSRLLGLFGDRVALTGAVNEARGNGTPTKSTVKKPPHSSSFQGTDASRWYRDTTPTDTLAILKDFATYVAKEQDWVHHRKREWARSKPPAPPTDDTPTSPNVDVFFEDIHPREWPHVPGKDVHAWDRATDPDAAHELQLLCATKLMSLPPGALRYEAISLEEFVADICAFIAASGVSLRLQYQDEPTSVPVETPTWTRASFRAVLVLLALGTHLQSASLLQFTAFTLMDRGDPCDLASVATADDHRLLDQILQPLAQFPNVESNASPTRKFPRLALPVPRCLVGSWTVDAAMLSMRDAFATDGRFLYVFCRTGLLVVGTGAGDTLRNVVYARNPAYVRGTDIERSWLCLVNGFLYCRTITMPGLCVDRISLDLQTITPLVLAPAKDGVTPSSIYALVSEGRYLYAVTSRDPGHANRTPVPPMLHRSKHAKRKSDKAPQIVHLNPIAVGNRVVRGPDWKWSNQDGEPGSVGTVERISTWGGVKGSGITVRWDKNQRMNTYRWGAEGCFDIQIVTEDSDGRVIAHTPLVRPTAEYASPLLASLAPSLGGAPPPLMLVQYDVERLERLVDVDEVHLPALLGMGKETPPLDFEDPMAPPPAIATSLHEHLLSECISASDWMCDGGIDGCCGASIPRFRCVDGCDYDLCRHCLTTTLVPDRMPVVEQEALPFALEDDAFHTAEMEPDRLASIEQLAAVWQGAFSSLECKVALLKHDFDATAAHAWLATSAEVFLRTPRVVPFVSAVALDGAVAALDPVVLIAGSFYATGSQLGIVLPGGLCGDGGKKRLLGRRATLRQGDSVALFSMTDGAALGDLTPVPDLAAGSPMAYDRARDRLLAYSTTSYLLMEFMNMEHGGPSLTPPSALRTGADVGIAVLSHLARIMGIRAVVPPLQHPVATLGLHVQLLSANPTSSKAKRRQLKKLVARVGAMPADPPRGYSVPFVFTMAPLRLLGAFMCAAADGPVAVLEGWLELLVGTLEEYLPANAPLGDQRLPALEALLLLLARGATLADGNTAGHSVVRLAQRALLWGLVHGLFFQEPDELATTIVQLAADVVVDATYWACVTLAPWGRPGDTYLSPNDALTGFLGSLLRTVAASANLVQRLLAATSVAWFEGVVELDAREVASPLIERTTAPSMSPAQRLLFAALACDVRQNEPQLLVPFLGSCLFLLQTLPLPALENSLVGTVLPVVLVSAPERAMQGVLAELQVLLATLDATTSADSACQAAEAAFREAERGGFFSYVDTVETAHPYGVGIPTFRKTVSATGATALRWRFDALSKTINSSDFVLVAPNAHVALDRIHADAVVDGCFVSGHVASWTPVSIGGDSATVYLCATTHPRDHLGQDKQRYGFKATVDAYYALPMPFTLRLQHQLAHLCAAAVFAGLRVEVASPLPDTMRRALAPLRYAADKRPWLDAQEAVDGLTALEARFGPIALRPQPMWRRMVLACFALLADTAQIDDDAAVRRTITDVNALQRWAIRQAQLENEWQAWLADDVAREDFLDRLAGNDTLLAELGELVGHPGSSATELFALISQQKTSPPQPAAPIAERIYDRALLALGLPMTDAPPPTGELPSRDALVMYLKFPAEAYDVPAILEQHEERAQQRMGCMQIVAAMLSFVQSPSTRRFFVGRLPAALWQAGASHIEALDGCELCSFDTAGELLELWTALHGVLSEAIAAPTTTFADKVLLCTDLVVLQAPSLLPTLLQVLEIVPTTPPTASTDSWPAASPVAVEHALFVEELRDVLWLAMRHVLVTTAGIEDCKPLLSSVSAGDAGRALGVVATLVAKAKAAPAWLEPVLLEHLLHPTQSPHVQMTACHILKQLVAAPAPAVARRVLQRIGRWLSTATDEASAAPEAYSVVLYWNNDTSESLLELVDATADKLCPPRVASWDVHVGVDTQAKQEELMKDPSIIHRNVRCDGCNLSPLTGYRFKCAVCANYDLCTGCYLNRTHDGDHAFLRFADATVAGDPLPARASASTAALVPDMALVGTRVWKATALLSELQRRGHVLLLADASAASAEALVTTILGLPSRFMCSMVPQTDVDLWQISDSTDPFVLNRMTQPMRASASYKYAREMASEAVSLCRRWLHDAGVKDVVLQSLRAVPRLLRASALGAPYFEALGSLVVLGGMDEPLRLGGFATLNGTRGRVQSLGTATATFDLGTKVETNVPLASLSPVAEVPVDATIADLVDDAVSAFAAAVHEVLIVAKGGDTVTYELSLRTLEALAALLPHWPAVLDNQAIAAYGDMPAALLQLAQLSVTRTEFIREEHDRAHRLAWEYHRGLHNILALGPCSASSTVPHALTDDMRVVEDDADDEPTYWYNVYAYADVHDVLPVHPGRNKLLDYWERYVIPAIQKYVRGSFKSYEMDYFFAQLREPLREGNMAAARQIAHTLCDGHVPPGCVFPDTETDWTALQMDDLVVGGRYVVQALPAPHVPAMAWCLGHVGALYAADPTKKLALLQLYNPGAGHLEHYWFHVAQLTAADGMEPSRSLYTPAVDAILVAAEKTALSAVARAAVWTIVERCPEYVAWTKLGQGYALPALLDMLATDLPAFAPPPRDHPLQKALVLQHATLVAAATRAPRAPKKPQVVMPTSDDLVQHLTQSLTSALEGGRVGAFVVTSSAPPEPLVCLRVPGASWLLLTFYTHPVLMDLPAGASLEVFYDADCTRSVRVYYGGRRGLAQLPPLVVAGSTCYIRTQAAEYARYKVRVDGVHKAFGLAAWLSRTLHALPPLSPAAVIGAWTSFLKAPAPPMVEQVAFRAIVSWMHPTVTMPPALVRRWLAQYETAYSKESPNALFSTYTQQLTELLSLLPGLPALPVLAKFARVTAFARALTADDVGRVPVAEVRAMAEKHERIDLFAQRLLVLQKLPRTRDQAGLSTALAKWLTHLALQECCGEADDQSMLSATDTVRFGILANVLFCPVDDDGYTLGYCVVDVGRDDIVPKLQQCIRQAPLFFEGDPTEEDAELMALLAESSASPPTSPTPPTEALWSCPVCTCENCEDSEACIACETPRAVAVAPSSTTASPPPQEEGWTCPACTFFNPWDNAHCCVCDMACDQVRPVPAEAAMAPTPTETPPATDAHRHSPTALRFVDAYAAGDARDPRIPMFLAHVLAVAPATARETYVARRRAGLDLQGEVSHAPSVEVAVAAQAKWTLAMDVQLLEVALGHCRRLGLLTLCELSPSHLQPDTKFGTLSLWELRLRFALLQEWNLLLLDTLALVDLKGPALARRIGAARRLVFPHVKIRLGSIVLDNTAETHTKRPTVVLDRLKWKQHPELVSLFESTRAQLEAVPPGALRAKRPLGASDPFVAFGVGFSGEHVVGDGGPYRQLFSDMAHECLRLGLFRPTPNGAAQTGELRDCVLPPPANTATTALAQYEFVGLLMGCCLRTGVHLPLRIAPVAWKLLVKETPTLGDLKLVDVAAYDLLTSPPVVDQGLTFTTTLSDGTTVELMHRGASVLVTAANWTEYVALATQARLHECQPQIDAMLRGVAKIVPLTLLSLYTWTELRQHICGSQSIDIALLKRHTKYAAGMTCATHVHLEYFWTALEQFSETDKRRFINFAWGQESLPSDDAEFDRTHTRLLIKPPPTTTVAQDRLLPKADTCFFNLELPAYSSLEVMAQRLQTAIQLCTSMDADEQTGGGMDVYYDEDDEEE